MRAGLTPFLAAGSLLYGLGLAADRARRRRSAVRLSRPVISIGNLTVGGTGKTPLLMKCASDLLTAGRRPAILTRGYRGAGRGSASGVVVEDGEPAGVSDEVDLMARKLPNVPVGAGADRARLAARLERRSDVFLLDDGFQHWPLQRDLDMVCIDVSDPWGGGHLLPWGRLREKPAALSRAGAIVLTRTELASQDEIDALRRRIAALSGAPVLLSRFALRLRAWGGSSPRIDVRGRKVIAMSAIGNPSAFERGLESMGAMVSGRRFADHRPYSDSDLDRVEEAARRQEAAIVTTEKDEVKLRSTRWSRSRPADVWIAEASLEFPSADARVWTRMLSELFQRS